eukprot:353171-Chlamydomonas_euryale.AAC.3
MGGVSERCHTPRDLSPRATSHAACCMEPHPLMRQGDGARAPQPLPRPIGVAVLLRGTASAAAAFRDALATDRAGGRRHKRRHALRLHLAA